MKKFPYCVPQTTNPHTAVPCYIYLWGRSCCVDFQLHFVAKTSSNLNVERCCHILSTLAQPCTMTQARWLYVELMQIKSLAINVLLLMHFLKPPGGGWRLLFLLILSPPSPPHTHTLTPLLTDICYSKDPVQDCCTGNPSTDLCTDMLIRTTVPMEPCCRSDFLSGSTPGILHCLSQKLI